MKVNQYIKPPESFNIFIICLFFIGVIYYSWIGYMASDDMMYTQAAENWVKSFPFLGDNHWALRHPLVISTALSYFLFGVNEYSLVLTTTFYFLMIVILTYMLFKKINCDISLMATLGVISTPLFAVQATISGCDIIELLFVIISITLFYIAINRQENYMFLVVGIASGFAWLTRETAVVLVVFYGILFVIGYGPRKNYWWIASGFLGVAAVEIFIYYIFEGDPFYRLWIDIDQGKSTGNALKPPGTGNIEISGLLNPLLSLFVNQEFMLLYSLFIPASLWLFKTSIEEVRHKKLLILFFWLAITWFIFVGYGLGVRALPRYFSVSSYFAVIIVFSWIGYVFKTNKNFYFLLLIAYFGSNAVGLYVENKQPLFGERALVEWLQNNPAESIYTDPVTYSSARYLLETNKLEKKVFSDVPKERGSYYMYNQNRVYQENREYGYADKYKPLDDWAKIIEIKPGRKWVGYVVEYIGFDSLLPENVIKKLNYPVGSVIIYKI